jgi:hypothetical protein
MAMEETIEGFECKVTVDHSILNELIAWYESHNLDATVAEHEVENVFSYGVTLMDVNTKLL